MPSDWQPPSLRPSHPPPEYRPLARVDARVQDDRPGELDLYLTGSMLRRRRWVILLGLISVFRAAAVLTSLWPKTYKSSVTFLVEKQFGNAESAALDVL